jgi:hypothetical protein
MAMPTNGSGFDTETIVSLLNALLSQSRSLNNSNGILISKMTALEKLLDNFVKVQTLTRDRRFEEEINQLETQLDVMKKQLEEKKQLKADIRSTSDKIKAITKEQIAEEAKKNKIDWLVVRQTMINAAAGALAIAIVWGIVTFLPAIGEGIKTFLGR